MEYLNSLNEKQLQAVTTKSKRVLVIAGAGSGKTKVLTERIKYLLDTGASKDEIVAFTFTKRAAKEMEFRLKKYKFDNVYTFHSFCFKLLVQNKNELGFEKFKKIRLVSDDYESKIIDDILHDLKISYSKRIIKDYISKRKNQLPFIYKNVKEEALLNKIYYLFQYYMMQHGQIDFDDMISLVVNNIDNLSIKDDLLDSCKYILVDECQDTNQIQYDLIMKLASKHHNIFFVGDEDQLIYSFRSSNIEMMNQFKMNVNEIIILNQNYRSCKNILDTANQLISNNLIREKKELFSLIPPKYEITYSDYRDSNQQAVFIANKIENLLKNKIRPNEIAVLYRNNDESLKIEYELRKRKIPYTLYGKQKFYKYTEVQRMLAMYQYLEDINDYISFRFAVPMDEPVYQKLVHSFNSANQNFLDQLISSEYEQLKEVAIKIKKVYEERTLYTKERLFDALVKILFKDLNTNTLNPLIEFKDLIMQSELEHEIDIVNEIMIDSDANKKEMGINLMTIHKSKGLEFRFVFIISLNDGILPANLKNDKDIEEERRLFYVAITRAKEYLHLSSIEYDYTNGVRKRLRPSIFIAEIK